MGDAPLISVERGRVDQLHPEKNQRNRKIYQTKARRARSIQAFDTRGVFGNMPVHAGVSQQRFHWILSPVPLPIAPLRHQRFWRGYKRCSYSLTLVISI